MDTVPTLHAPLKVPAIAQDVLEDLEKPEVFEAYVMWKSLPSVLRYPPHDKKGNPQTPKEFAEKIGIDDDTALEMINLRTKEDFAARYGVHVSTLTRWNRRIAKRDVLGDIRAWAQPLNRNVALSLYEKAMKGGLPEHYALWFKLVSGWSEKIRIDQRVIKTVRLEVHDVPPPDRLPTT